MGFGNFVNKLFRQPNEIKENKEEDEIIKSLSLAACEENHKILMECYKNSWLGSCQSEMEGFWKCVNDHKAKLKQRAKTYRKNNKQYLHQNHDTVDARQQI